MSKQPPSIMQTVPQKKTYRNGQKDAFEEILKTDHLCIKLPTGYGKTITGLGCYKRKKDQGEINKLLVIFPTLTQLAQFENDGKGDAESEEITGILDVFDIGFFKHKAIDELRNNFAQIFATTIQFLSDPNGLLIIDSMLKIPGYNWMIIVDEYHHYGATKKWGEVVNSLERKCFLAMSATPHRPEDDSAFGKPDMQVLYLDAVEEQTVKPLCGHAYNYRIDAGLKNGEIISYTIDEIIKEAGSSKPEAIEKMRITKDMRWLPGYVSPLITIPIERMISERIRTGLKLQVLISAMTVSHAQMICEQVKERFDEFKIDWVGTNNGEFGRSKEENKKILTKFCPPKHPDGKRYPELDILVHVNMAGEGLDSTNVSEIVQIHNTGKNNKNDQIHGRASRYLEDVIGHINFDATSDYAIGNYVGSNIMLAMDSKPINQDEEINVRISSEYTSPLLPENLLPEILNVELVSIDSGSPEVRDTAARFEQKGKITKHYLQELLDDPNHPD